MTLIFGTITGLLVGMAFGRSRLSLALVSLAWYVFMAAQTVYLAQPGATGFGGLNGTEVVSGWLYWLMQPAVLLLCLGLLWIGSLIRNRISHAMHPKIQDGIFEAATDALNPRIVQGRVPR